MKRILSLLFVVIAVLIGIPASAQDSGNPIIWRMNVKMTSDCEGEMILKAIIQPGWHLYGLKLPQGGPKPTVIDVNKSTGLEFISGFSYTPDIVESDDPMFGLRLNWWSSTVTFRRKFRLTDSKAMLRCTVTFMGCNDENCLPPATKTLTKAITKKQ